MTLHFDPITGIPECERCAAHWWAEKPRVGNPEHYFRRFHTTNGHR